MSPPTLPPEVRARTLAKARVLLDALPYFRDHAGSTVVIKVGGAAMDEGRLAETFADDVALLRLVGVRPVIVHGGGPQITKMAARLGIEPEFINGHRVTDEATLEVARMVLLGLVNQDLVSHLVRRGTSAVGLSGGDDSLLVVRPRSQELGLVGEVESVNTGLLRHLMERVVPVVASIGTDREGQAYNVNADLVAGAVAAQLGASKLVYLTDVQGVLDGDGELVTETSVAGAQELLDSGAADGGMIPKLESAIHAMRAGVNRTHLIDGRVEHALILELFTPEGLGTMIAADAPEVAAVAAEGPS